MVPAGPHGKSRTRGRPGPTANPWLAGDTQEEVLRLGTFRLKKKFAPPSLSRASSHVRGRRGASKEEDDERVYGGGGRARARDGSVRGMEVCTGGRGGRVIGCWLACCCCCCCCDGWRRGEERMLLLLLLLVRQLPCPVSQSVRKVSEGERGGGSKRRRNQSG